MKIIYIILFVSCFISTFSNLSNGAFFTENKKGIITAIHWLILIVLSITSIFVGGAWYYILLIPIISLLISWTLAFILAKTIFRNLNIGK